MYVLNVFGFVPEQFVSVVSRDPDRYTQHTYIQTGFGKNILRYEMVSLSV